MVAQKFAKLLADRPPLHSWGGELQTGGFEDASLEYFCDLLEGVARNDDLRVIEIGAGLTTLASLCAGATKHVSVCAEAATFSNIRRYALDNAINVGALVEIVGRSEVALAEFALAQDGSEFDLAVIDGGHNFPQCWIDYVYCNKVLKRGGLMLIDDIEIYSCRQLALFLKHNSGWKDRGGVASKCKVFEKLSDRAFDEDFGSSSFILGNMLW